VRREAGSPVDRQLIEALDGPMPARIEARVNNVMRAVGASVSGEIARRRGHSGLPEGSLQAVLTGTAGQSFGAFLARGVSLDLVGDANDYVGKGLCGGRLVVRPPEGAPREAAANIVVGNTCLYGATEGEAYFSGVAGERFAVRNSGAHAVVEGTGDHGCEYMTGGLVVVLGNVGRNFAAGMSGGIAYVYDPDGQLKSLCNPASIELESVRTGRPVSGFDRADPLHHDAERLRHFVERHFELTGSGRARALLDDWNAAAGRFVKVVPIDYRRALAEIEAAAVAAE
jgi:glutamate synthase (NADPH/NADH) large chain